jgi:N-acetylneuraminic acid mutarotase
MRGDFSRFTFNPRKHYSGVLLQQGRVQLDADWNEQQAIIGHRLTTETQDLIGADGAPQGNAGFQIVARHGLRFDGDDDYVRVDVPRGLSFEGTSPFTIETWVNPDPSGAGGTVLSKYSSTASDPLGEAEYYLEVEPDGTVCFHRVGSMAGVAAGEVSSGQLAVQSVRSIRPVVFGRYSHVVLVYDGDEGRLYIDGQLAGIAPLTLQARETITSFLIGARLAGLAREGFYTGIVGETRVWSRERLPSELASQMYEVLQGNEDGLVACWQFDEAVGNMARDRTGRDNDGAFGEAITDQPERVRPVWITRGRYYVNGTLCENEENVDLAQQPDYPQSVLPADVAERSSYLAYLDVWERSVTALEDSEIREVALGGPDTSTRARSVWQVKLLPVDAEAIARDSDALQDAWEKFLWRAQHKATMRSRRQQVGIALGNQLYRVEIHDHGGRYGWPRPNEAAVTSVPAEEVSGDQQQVRVRDWLVDDYAWAVGDLVEVFSAQTDRRNQPGPLARITNLDHSTRTLTLDGLPSEIGGHAGVHLRRVASFKWSRENGTVGFPVTRIQTESGTVTLQNLGNDLAALKEGDWVELADDEALLLQRAYSLSRVESIDRTHLQVTLSQLPPSEVGTEIEKHPRLIRWDQVRVTPDPEASPSWLDSDQMQQHLLRYGVIPAYADRWIGLEDGIQVYLAGNGYYRTGDFWLLPSRTLQEDIEWPRGPLGPLTLPPHGVRHHYACLALLEISNRNITVHDRRQTFPLLTTQYVQKTGDTISGSLGIAGSLNVGGSVVADSLSGTLGSGTVGADQLLDHSVTQQKLDSTIGTVPSGFSILGDTAAAPPGYVYTGTTIVSVNPQSAWVRVSEIPAQIGGQPINPGVGTVACAPVGQLVYILLADGTLLEYSPLDNDWAVKSPLPSGRRDFAVTVWNNLMFVVGGTDPNGTRSALTESYDQAMDTWDLRAPMPTARSNVAAAALGGRIFATGGVEASGRESNSHEAYSPESDSWERLADLPTERSDLVMGEANGKLYAIGGEKGKFLGIFGEAISGENEEYRPAENTWSSRKAPMPVPAKNVAVASIGNSLYAIGGVGREGMLGVTQRYDPYYDRWQEMPPLPSPMAYHGAVVINGEIFAIGGGASQVLRVSINSTFYIHRKT